MTLDKIIALCIITAVLYSKATALRCYKCEYKYFPPTNCARGIMTGIPVVTCPPSSVCLHLDKLLFASGHRWIFRECAQIMDPDICTRYIEEGEEFPRSRVISCNLCATDLCNTQTSRIS